MPATNVEIVRSMYRALAAGDTSALLAAFDQDVIVEHPDSAESYQGPDGLVDWAARWREALRGLELQTQSFVEADDQVVVLSRFVALEAAGGECAEAHFAQLWTVRGGKVSSVRLYLDWKTAMQAAGFQQ